MSEFNKAKIAAIATCVPEFSLDFKDEMTRFYGSDRARGERVQKALKLERRHIVRGYATALDMGLEAANAIFQAGYDRGKIDALIFITQTPDFTLPSNAAIAHQRLGLKSECAIFDVNQGCAGYVYGLWLASSLIQAGAAKAVLMLAGDTISRIVSQNDTNLTPLIGDATCASVIERANAKSYFKLATYSQGFESIICAGGGFRAVGADSFKDKRIMQASPSRSINDMYMDGMGVFNFALHQVSPLLKELLNQSGISAGELDYLILHQANQLMLNKIAAAAGFSQEQTPTSLTSKFGNLGSASIAATITHALSQKLGSSKLRLALAGFGVGLSVAVGIVELDEIIAPPMLYLKE